METHPLGKRTKSSPAKPYIRVSQTVIAGCTHDTGSRFPSCFTRLRSNRRLPGAYSVLRGRSDLKLPLDKRCCVRKACSALFSDYFQLFETFGVAHHREILRVKRDDDHLAPTVVARGVVRNKYRCSCPYVDSAGLRLIMRNMA